MSQFSYLMFSNEQLHVDSHHIKASISSRDVIFLFYINICKHNNKTSEYAKKVLAPELCLSEHNLSS